MALEISSKWDLEYSDNGPNQLRIEARCTHDGVEFGLYALIHPDHDPMAVCDQLRTMLENSVAMHDQNKPWRKRMQAGIRCL